MTEKMDECTRVENFLYKIKLNLLLKNNSFTIEEWISGNLQLEGCRNQSVEYITHIYCY